MHNAERTISETLNSVRAQTYRDLDIVVVDDGSSDSSAAIVTEHVRQDRRIRLVQHSMRE